jgi:hypothetical protein
MSRFLVDEDSPKGLAWVLSEVGFDAVHVVTADLSGMSNKILAWGSLPL